MAGEALGGRKHLLLLQQGAGCFWDKWFSSPECNSETALAAVDAAGISFSNIFAFLGFNRLFLQDVFDGASRLALAVAGLQTIFGIVFLFFLGLGLRNRFRLK